MISVRCLVTAAASVVGLVHGPDTSSLDLVYQLHELAERVQLPPERDYELAAMLYEQAVALDPLNAALRYNAGIVQKNVGNHRAAIEMYEAALALDPSLRQADFNLARSLQMLSDQVDRYENQSSRSDDLMRALSHFEASVTPAEPGGLKNAEEVLYQLGRVDEARAMYMKYVQLRPRGAVHAHDRLRCTDEETDGSLREYLSDVARLSAGALAPLPEPTVAALCDLSLLLKSDGNHDRLEDDGKESQRTETAPNLLLQPHYERVQHEYRQRHYAAFHCPAALSGQLGADLAAYYDVWHTLGLTYREENPHSEDFLARGRHALDNEALSLFIADQLAPSVSAIVGAEVKTSFTKVAVMDETAYLPKHRDEATSEFTITAVLRADTISPSGEGATSASWPIHLQQPPSGLAAAPEPVSIALGLGDCLFFNGRDFLHWRNYLDGHQTGPDREEPPVQPAAKFTMLLLHYVHADFPESTCPSGDSGECILQQDFRRPLPGDLLMQPSDTRMSKGDQELSGQCPANALCDEGDSTVDGLHSAGGVQIVEAGSALPRYLIYSPCVITTRPGVCSQQFNNQFWALQHALAVAEAMGRVLVLPEFMVLKPTDELLEEATALAGRVQEDAISGSDAAAVVDIMLAHMVEKGFDQQWFPTGHFFDVQALAAASTHGVIETQEFLQTVGETYIEDEDEDEDEDDDDEEEEEDTDEEQEGWVDGYYDADDGPVLRSVIVHPPYLVPRQDPRKIYDGAYYRQLGLRWLHGPPHPDDGWARPTRVSVHPEVVQAKSGRGQMPYVPGEGKAYWGAAEAAWTSQATEVNALLTAEASLPADPGSAAAIDQLTSTVMTEHSGRLDNDTLARLGANRLTADDKIGGAHSKLPFLQQQSSPRVIAFDFAPSYNFHVDRLRFDPELRNVRRRFRWIEAVTAPARRIERELRLAAVAGGSQLSYVAIHLRRRGYGEFCSSGLDFYQRKRFGVEVSEEMCWPTADTVADEALAAASAVGTNRVFVATDDPEGNASQDIQALRAKGLEVWLAHTVLAAETQVGPELRPLVEQAVCAAADHFIGNLASTFSFAIAQEREVRGMTLETMSFWNSGSAAGIAAAAVTDER